jgi:uncharacterized membrane protein
MLCYHTETALFDLAVSNLRIFGYHGSYWIATRILGLPF